MSDVARPKGALHRRNASTHPLSRRGFLGLSTGLSVGAALGSGLSAPAAAASAGAAAAAARFPGHRPGQVYLGMSASTWWDGAVAQTGPVGLRRSFGNWTTDDRIFRMIAQDHAAGRMPWVSFKAPTANAAGWRQVASGRLDAELRAKARRYAALSRPAIVTFHHEPGDGGTQAEGADYAAAWCRIYDIFRAEGALARVAFAPILSDWLFQPRNGGENPADWVTPGMLSRISTNSFLGVDVYQNQTNDGFDERLGQVLAWTASRGYSTMMVGVGESASCRYFGGSPQPENWMRDNWAWCEANANKIAAYSYFNSSANSKSAHHWRLDESGTTKLGRYKSMLASSVSCGL